MDPIMPIYPPLDDRKQETAPVEPGQVVAATAAFPSPQEASPAPSFGGTSHPLSPRPTQLYSPTRQEIESHPIRQRLSITRDDIVTGLGTAPEESQDLFDSTSQTNSRQAQEGSERLFDAMSEAPNVKEGDEVSYQWSGGRPGGTVAEVATEGAVTMETSRGNEVKKNAEPGNPALYIERQQHDVVKKASEVDVEKSGDVHDEDHIKEGGDEEKKEENGEPQTGDKRAAEDTAEEKKDEGKAKKQKTNAAPKENGEKPKKKGRPAKGGANGQAAAKKENKKRPPKKAATESGEPRRSGRNASKSE